MLPGTNHTTRKLGFTLIEMMMVVAIIAVIASMAIPNLLSSRVTANETAAIATLRAIASAQAQAQSRCAVDEDADGQGEYLYLAELSGSVNLRGQTMPLDPAIVSVSLGNVATSVVNKAGYFFAMYLPDASAAGVAEDAAGGKVGGVVDPDMCETFWIVYAWPASAGSSGRRAFVVNETGTILQTSNAQNYEGTAVMPPYDAALAVAGDMTAKLSIKGSPSVATDGALWLTIN